jgi:prepilin-type N-terminal cleavage/methylation domain-containing protein
MVLKKAGFTIIELLIVITIIGILVGVAVPYYNDYIYDSRVSVLKQNLATMRTVINQFRGDRGRGPFRVQVNDGGTPAHYPFSSNTTNGSELVAGAFMPNGTRQTNIKYLKSLPNFVDPVDGSNMVNTIQPTGDATVRFRNINGNTDSDGVPIFDIDAEPAFFDENGDGLFDSNEPLLYGSDTDLVVGDFYLPMDYIDFNVSSADGTTY